MRDALPDRPDPRVRPGRLRGLALESSFRSAQARDPPPRHRRHRSLHAAPVLPRDAPRHRTRTPPPALVLAHPASAFPRLGHRPRARHRRRGGCNEHVALPAAAGVGPPAGPDARLGSGSSALPRAPCRRPGFSRDAGTCPGRLVVVGALRRRAAGERRRPRPDLPPPLDAQEPPRPLRGRFPRHFGIRLQPGHGGRDRPARPDPGLLRPGGHRARHQPRDHRGDGAGLHVLRGAPRSLGDAASGTRPLPAGRDRPGLGRAPPRALVRKRATLGSRVGRRRPPRTGDRLGRSPSPRHGPGDSRGSAPDGHRGPVGSPRGASASAPASPGDGHRRDDRERAPPLGGRERAVRPFRA